MHILIVKLSAIGDIVHTLPALAEIRAEMPEAEITWVAETRAAEILRGNELINTMVEIDTRSLSGGKTADGMALDIGAQASLIRSRKYDIALDFQGLFKSAGVARVSGAKKRWGFSRKDLREPLSRFLLTDTVAIPPRTHVVNKNQLLARTALGLKGRPGVFEFPIFTGDEHKAQADEMIKAAGGKFALLNPAGGWVTKLWHAEKYGILADMIYDECGIIPLMAIGPNDSELAERAVANSRSGKLQVITPGLKTFYEVARRAEFYVGGDTGPTHIALAANAPVIGIFGPTEWWRNGSLNPDDICVERTDIDCRVDCHRRTCDKWICMDIEPETVMAAIKRRIGLNIK